MKIAIPTFAAVLAALILAPEAVAHYCLNDASKLP